MGKTSKNKGKVGERELARKLREYGYDARRTAQYCGKAEDGEADLVGLPGIHIECKRTESLRLYDAMAQAKHDSQGKSIPAVFHRKNNHDWLVILPLDDFMTIYKEYEASRYITEKEKTE